MTRWTMHVYEGDRVVWIPGHNIENQRPAIVTRTGVRKVTIKTDDGVTHVVSWRTVLKPITEAAS